MLYAKYIDFSLPKGGSSEIISAAVVKISGQNMDEILNTFEKKGIPVFLSDLVSNVKDIEPFNSIEDKKAI